MSSPPILFGGTFDPIHLGHMLLAEAALDELDADQVVFIPAGSPPHKGSAHISDADVRLHMVRLAIEENDRFTVWTGEIERGGASYAIDTIDDFRSRLGGIAPYFLIGEDSLADLAGWRSPEEIVERSMVVVARRPGSDGGTSSPFASRVRFLDTPLLGISSSEIRKRIRLGNSIRYAVTEKVRRHIADYQLYDTPAGVEGGNDGA